MDIKSIVFLIALGLAPAFVASCGGTSDQPDETSKIYPLAEPVLGVTLIPTGQTETHIYRPAGEGPFPAVYFLQGYPCRSVDPKLDKNKVRGQLLSHYIDAGFLVYLAEKPGLGGEGSQSSKACKDMTYPEEVAAFDASFDGLLAHPDVDPKNIFLFGHSLGGQTAPLIAQNRDVKGIITYGIHAKPWFEFMIDLSRQQGERLGMDPKAVDRETALMIPFLYDLMIARKDWDYLEKNHQDAIAVGIMPAKGQMINGRDYRFWATLNDPNFVDAWANYDGKVLSFYGSYDIASLSTEGANRIARTVNFYNPGQARAIHLEQADHGFVRFDGDFEDYKKQRFSPDWTPEKIVPMFDKRIADETIRWMNDVIEN